jgi:hypothetical protein
MPPRPVFTPDAQSRHMLSENGKSFIQLLQVGLLHRGHALVIVFVLQR